MRIIINKRRPVAARLPVLVVVAALGAGTVTGCSMEAPGGASATGAARGSTVVILDNNPLGTYNPVNNHGRNGESLIFQGLYRPVPGASGDRPELAPVLADGAAVASDENRTWTVRTRTGVTFTDGTSFGPEDVVATYSALINPAVASTELVRWQQLSSVEQTGDDEVTFRLTDPSPEFDRLLLTGIAPSERLAAERGGPGGARPAKESSLNTDPVGTGPYQLQTLRADEAVLVPNPAYAGPAPQVERVVLRHVEDGNARAQQLAAGEGDGTTLDARLAAAFQDDPAFTVTSRPSADWHAVTLPAAHPFVGDPKVRRALNLAVDREGMVQGALGGYGQANSTFLAPFHGDAYDPELEIPHDPAQAERLLDDAGWTTGADGVRQKDGTRAEFDLIYFTNVGDTRADLALATASELQKIGVVVNPVAKNSADVGDDDYRTTPVVLGGGSQPYSVTAQLYTVLHSQYAAPGAGAKWDNASDYVNADVDAALDAARVESDVQARNRLYRDVQRAYSKDPGMLQLAYLNHVYVERDLGWTQPGVVLEPHSHGVEFGPWYTVAEWTRE